MKFRPFLLAVITFGCAVPLSAQDAAPSIAVKEVYTGPTVYAAEVVTTYPHDASAFTQGLLWHNGALYESTGREGQSVVRKVKLATGETIVENAIPADQFGEGLALWADELISLTWRNGVIHRWKAATLDHIASRPEYPLEGWGLTTSPEGLVHSDGSATLRILDPESYEVLRSVDVTINGRPLRKLNELEMIDGLVYANVWGSGFIVAIDPADGVVRRLIDLRAIVDSVPVSGSDAVLNGIAWDAENRRMFVTGKLWPSLYEIALRETEAQVR